MVNLSLTLNKSIYDHTYKLSVFLDRNNRIEKIYHRYYDNLKEFKEDFKLSNQQFNRLEKYSKLIVKNIQLKVNILDNKLYIYTILNKKFIKLASIIIINNKLYIDLFENWFFTFDALNDFLNTTLNITINQDLIDLFYANILANNFIK